MIRLIIVDDEETTRDSLMELVPWQEHGIDACRSARNGLDALEVAADFPPSILLCDVKMPKMDGIELAKRVRVLYPDCAIVFLSGYSDKEYLKTAIRLNAIDYLEKPVDLVELKAIFTQIVSNLKRKTAEIAALDKLKDSLDANLPLIRLNFLKDLIAGHPDESLFDAAFARALFARGDGQAVELDAGKDAERDTAQDAEQDAMRKAGLETGKKGNPEGVQEDAPETRRAFRVLTVRLNWRNAIRPEEKNPALTRLGNALVNLDRIGGAPALTGFLDDTCWVAVFRTETQVEAQTETHAEKLTEMQVETLTEKQSETRTKTQVEPWTKAPSNLLPDAFQLLSLGDYTFSAGISEPVSAPADLPAAHQSSLTAANRQFYHGTNRVFLSEVDGKARFEINKSHYARFRKTLLHTSDEEATALLTELTEEIAQAADPDIPKIRNVYFTLLMQILDVTLNRGGFPDEEGNGTHFVWQDVDSQVTLRGLYKLLLSHLRLIFRKSGDRDAALGKTHEILTFLNSHFTDNQLSIQSVANAVDLSQTYLCALFKKSTGQTLNEHITGLRIERAKELILENRLKLYEIAAAIGFSDVNYFSTLFKRHVGWTPSEYREKMQHDQKGTHLLS